MKKKTNLKLESQIGLVWRLNRNKINPSLVPETPESSID